MTGHLLDTCIIIDYLRDRPAAVSFLESRERPPAVSVVSIAELFEGIRSRTEEDTVAAVLTRLSACDVTWSIARQAGLWRQQFKRSHGLSMPDALIAATAAVHQLRLVTRNVRHFPMLDDILVPGQ